ncbi:MAG TPA: hypothetical protein VLZ05_04195 [Mycobacterium sp.]|nr:hypothetical protein [Mycobacterium sp.]HUH68135.1 hypothetical protein [Mycobacterium sp.]
MGDLLLVLSLMAVPLMILVAVGCLNWRDGRRWIDGSRRRRGHVAPTDSSTRPQRAPTSHQRVDVYLRR